MTKLFKTFEVVMAVVGCLICFAVLAVVLTKPIFSKCAATLDEIVQANIYEMCGRMECAKYRLGKAGDDFVWEDFIATNSCSVIGRNLPDGRRCGMMFIANPESEVWRNERGAETSASVRAYALVWCADDVRLWRVNGGSENTLEQIAVSLRTAESKRKMFEAIDAACK